MTQAFGNHPSDEYITKKDKGYYVLNHKSYGLMNKFNLADARYYVQLYKPYLKKVAKESDAKARPKATTVKIPKPAFSVKYKGFEIHVAEGIGIRFDDKEITVFAEA